MSGKKKDISRAVAETMREAKDKDIKPKDVAKQVKEFLDDAGAFEQFAVRCTNDYKSVKGSARMLAYDLIIACGARDVDFKYADTDETHGTMVSPGPIIANEAEVKRDKRREEILRDKVKEFERNR